MAKAHSPPSMGMNALDRSVAYVPNETDLRVVQSLSSELLPVISVVIPSFNQASFLRATIKSVLLQRYPHVEVFVADGGSTDGSLAILAEYAEKCPGYFRFVSERDHGQANAVNKAIEATHGELIAWINSDDVYVADAFWKIACFFHFNRCALIVYGRNRYVDLHLVPTMDYPASWSAQLREQRRRMMHLCLPPQPSLFFRRVVFNTLGKLTENPALDYELWLRWQQDCPFYFIDDYLSLSRLHPKAKSLTGERQLYHDICNLVHRSYWIVPYNWTRNLAYYEAYGNLWMTGKTFPITRTIRRRGLFYWIYLNLLWGPRGLLDIARHFRDTLIESLRT